MFSYPSQTFGLPVALADDAQQEYWPPGALTPAAALVWLKRDASTHKPPAS
jgi:hypothetical protein